MNDLNNDWVLWVSIASIVLTIVVVWVSAKRIFRAMDGLEEDK